jgi:hypothetical protein
MEMWLLPMPVILIGAGSCSGGGTGFMSGMSAMEWLAPIG